MAVLASLRDWGKKRSRRVRGRENVRESGIVLADCVSSPRSSHRTSFAQEVQEGRRKEMLLLTQQRQLFEVKRPTDRAEQLNGQERGLPCLSHPHNPHFLCFR